ncbi:MAG: hypothetical protein HYY03_08625 [Chloroflexi bacterium]|nr:hypothetical protein [Chloroflexota bacterium]
MGQEPRDDLFKGAKVATFELPLLEETLSEARALIGENGWPEQEGLQIIFANGVYYLLGEKCLRGAATDATHQAAEVERLTAELMEMHSKYAVMKFRAFTLQQAKQTLEFNVVGLERENRWSGERLRQFRQDEEQLRAELRAVRAERDALRQWLASHEGSAPVQAPGQSKGRLGALLRRLGRR